MENLNNLIFESLQLLLLGMGSVVFILVMLILLITLVSKLVTNYQDDLSSHSAEKFGHKAHTTLPQQEELIAVISSAIKAFKKRHPSSN